MAFQKKTWLARLGQGLNKFIFNGGSKVTLDSSPDVVTQEGTPLSADNMNDLEERIEDAITSLTPSAVTFTAGTFVNVNRMLAFRIGKMLFISGIITPTTAISSGNIIVTFDGLTFPSGYNDLPLFDYGNNKVELAYGDGTSKLYNNTTLANGVSYAFNGWLPIA